MGYEQEILQRITRFLLLRGSFISNIGLLNGKMGIAIFFYLYSKLTNNKLYADFAGELIDEIYDKMSLEIPLGFGDGLAGIAWGIHYLVDNHFVYGDIDCILEDFDYKIQELDVRKIKDVSLETGLKGLAYYVISRYGNRSYRNSIISNDYIGDLINSLMSSNVDDDSVMLVEQLNKIINLENKIVSVDLLYQLTRDIQFNPIDLFKDARSLGIINNGISGIGLNLIWKYRL